METSEKKKMGFSAMNPELQRMIAKKGAAANHKNGTAHKFTTEEARAAAIKSQASRKANRESKNVA
jgi:hypothetical protein